MYVHKGLVIWHIVLSSLILSIEISYTTYLFVKVDDVSQDCKVGNNDNFQGYIVEEKDSFDFRLCISDMWETSTFYFILSNFL